MFRILRRFIERYRMSRYNDFTIAEHFRRQGAQVGENCRILIRELCAEPFLIRIGNHCTIAGEVVFTTHDGGTWVFTEELPSLQHFGTIEILDNCFIGARAIVLPNVRIGPNSIVGAGAVVTRDVPPNTVVVGCPAKPLCSLEDYKSRVVAAWQQQRPPGYFADLQDGTRYSAEYLQACKQRDWGLLRRHLETTLWKRS